MTKLLRTTACASLLLTSATAFAAAPCPNIFFLFANGWAWPHASRLG